jgi:hypothetical protein
MDLRSDVREPRKSDHAAGRLADIMVDALSSEASRKTGGPSETKLACVSFTFLPEAGVSPQGDHTPPTDVLLAWGMERKHHRNARHVGAVVYLDLTRVQAPLELRAGRSGVTNL